MIRPTLSPSSVVTPGYLPRVMTRTISDLVGAWTVEEKVAEWDVLNSFLGGSTIIFYFILCERLFTVFSTGNEKSMFSADVGHGYVILDCVCVYVFKSVYLLEVNCRFNVMRFVFKNYIANVWPPVLWRLEFIGYLLWIIYSPLLWIAYTSSLTQGNFTVSIIHRPPLELHLHSTIVFRPVTDDWWFVNMLWALFGHFHITIIVYIIVY